METLLPPIITKVLELGLPGLMIIYLIWRMRVLETENGKLDDRILELQEKRLVEAQETVRTLGRNEYSNDKIGSALTSQAEKLAAVAASLDRLERDRK